MYTKIFFFIALFSLIFSTALAKVTNQKTNRQSVNTNSHQGISTIGDKSKKDNTFPLGMDWTDNFHSNYAQLKHHHSDEDGKSHHFNFDQLNKKKRGRRVFGIVAKFLVLIAHLSSLIAAFAYILH